MRNGGESSRVSLHERHGYKFSDAFRRNFAKIADLVPFATAMPVGIGTGERDGSRAPFLASV